MRLSEKVICLITYSKLVFNLIFVMSEWRQRSVQFSIDPVGKTVFGLREAQAPVMVQLWPRATIERIVPDVH